jgi:glycosyltransferase involved in cell wall biosynthesis
MDKKKIEVFIINFNGKDTILSTIESLYNSEEVEVSISVIDDHSNDESPELIRKCYPDIPVHIMSYNTKEQTFDKAIEWHK